MNIEEKVAIALGRLDAAIKLFQPIEVFGLYSGGHDSFCACFVASLHPRFSGAVHINTGIGVESTREHVRQTCQEKCWKLFEYKASENTKSDGTPDPKCFDDWVMQYGFPGPAQHKVLYVNLKERCVHRLERDCGASARGKKQRRVMHVTGVRLDESQRRMGNVRIEPEVRGRAVWVNPIHDWTKLDTTELISHIKAKRNPVVDLIHKSGECLCGAFAQPGELEELGAWDLTRPAYDRIIKLQNEVMKKFPWGWEGGPPKEYLEEKRGQQFMEPMKQMLCWKCIGAQNLT